MLKNVVMSGLLVVLSSNISEIEHIGAGFAVHG